MQIKVLLPIAVFGQFALVQYDPESAAGKKLDAYPQIAPISDLLMPCLLVDPLGINMRPRPGERPEKSFFPLLSCSRVRTKKTPLHGILGILVGRFG